MKKNPKNSEERTTCSEENHHQAIIENYREDEDFLICCDTIDPIEYLKGPNSLDYGTVFEYYREERRRKRERVQKMQALKNRIRIFWNIIFKKNSELTK